MSADAPLIDVRGLCVEAPGPEGPRRILDDVSFALPARSVLGVIGESGSGKTVLAHALASWLPGGLRVSAGEIRFRGRDVLAMSAGEAHQLRGRDIGYVGGNPSGALDPTMSVGAQIVEKLRAVEPGVSKQDAKDRVISLLTAVRIPSAEMRFNEYPHQYSGGMMQRAMIVDALVTNPSLLIADNITQPLDVTVGAQIVELLRELARKFDTGILFVTSSLPTAADLADQILVLEQGRVVECRDTASLVATPQHSYTAKLINELPTLWRDPGKAPPAGEGQPVLSVREVAKSYEVGGKGGWGTKRQVQAVRYADFDVFEGENFGVVGESGCGKSTLMRLLTGLERPDAGQIRFEGQDIFAAGAAGLRTLRRRLQLVLQDPYGSLPPQSSIGQIIAEPLEIHGLAGRKERRARTLEIMGEVGLAKELYNALPAGLSAGQRQRINVARAMIMEPRMLIMDETLSALDQTEQGRLIDLFERLQAQHGFTYLFISHDIALVRRVCARVAVMYLGEVVELAHNERLFFDPGHPYSRALLSAAPTLEQRRYRPEDCLLEGEPPSPIDLPPGCAFATRCPVAFDRCRSENPTSYGRGHGDRAACFLVDRAANEKERSHA